MNFRRVFLTCALSLAPLNLQAAETTEGPRFEVERDWSGELRPRYRGPQPPTAPMPVPPPQARPQREAPADMRVTQEPEGRREARQERDTFALEGPRWEQDDRRTGPERAWSERERRERAWREREYAERAYAEQAWREELYAERERRERIRARRDRRHDFGDDEAYWDDCDRGWNRC